ncbi:zinc/cadmium resistance protein-like [Patiria miniata]|uniref:Cation efflux protein transmembrane domain-containing protein n=1 Tax=Patiria miniata TaxID=46514 RepID=A0A913ZYM1_PATMI|nr:zinc/cadmium resistance protein-like [Patiria miniata]
MGRFTGKSCRFLAMISLTTVFFLVELVTGYATNSLALVSDSFHMLSDIIALVIGFLALRISKRSSPTGSWKRAEVLGALINSVLLIALCFTIFVDAVQRLIVVEAIENPVLVLIVGCVGLVINGVGLCLFGSHGMPHGHSHGGVESHAHERNSKWQKLDLEPLSAEEEETALDEPSSTVKGTKELSDETKTVGAAPSHAHLNMRGVFLHVLGDALGSVVVIISALFIWLTDFEWRYYVDPAMSLIIVAIITVTTVPLFRQSSKLLLQSLPSEMNEEDSTEKLQRDKTGTSYLATAHIWFHDKDDYTIMADDIKSYLMDKGIDATTTIRENTDVNVHSESANGACV